MGAKLRGISDVDGRTVEVSVASGPSGSGAEAPVACVLAIPTVMDISAIGRVKPSWATVNDDFFNMNELPGIPPGMGLSFPFDSVATRIHVDEAGVWAFTYTVGSNQEEDTIEGIIHSLSTNTGQQFKYCRTPRILATLSEIVSFPAGAFIEYEIYTQVAAAISPYQAYATLGITRLG